MSGETSLMSAGLDSISATELTRVLERKLELELPATLLFDYPTLDDLMTVIVSLKAHSV